MSRFAFIPVNANGVADYVWVDADVAEELGRFSWHTQGGCYAATSALGLMHRYLLGIPKGDPRVVHHINEDALDNRRENLQVVARDVHGALPHPRRDAYSRALHANHEVVLSSHLRVVALEAEGLVAA